MYAIIVKDEQELRRLAGEKGFKIVHIEDVCRTENIKEQKSFSVSEFLLTLGIRPHIKGFKYLTYIFEQNINPEYGITKHVYPVTAKHFKTTPSRVERSIRHAIETAIYPENSDIYSRLFGVFDYHPTNAQFISGCKNYLDKTLKNA